MPLIGTTRTTSVLSEAAALSVLSTNCLISSKSVVVQSRARLLVRSSVETERAGGRCWLLPCGWGPNGNGSAAPPLPPEAVISGL